MWIDTIQPSPLYQRSESIRELPTGKLGETICEWAVAYKRFVCNARMSYTYAYVFVILAKFDRKPDMVAHFSLRDVAGKERI